MSDIDLSTPEKQCAQYYAQEQYIQLAVLFDQHPDLYSKFLSSSSAMTRLKLATNPIFKNTQELIKEKKEKITPLEGLDEETIKEQYEGNYTILKDNNMLLDEQEYPFPNIEEVTQYLKNYEHIFKDYENPQILITPVASTEQEFTEGFTEWHKKNFVKDAKATLPHYHSKFEQAIQDDTVQYDITTEMGGRNPQIKSSISRAEYVEKLHFKGYHVSVVERVTDRLAGTEQAKKIPAGKKQYEYHTEAFKKGLPEGEHDMNYRQWSQLFMIMKEKHDQILDNNTYTCLNNVVNKKLLYGCFDSNDQNAFSSWNFLNNYRDYGAVRCAAGGFNH